jgi:hypothetical protein
MSTHEGRVAPAGHLTLTRLRRWPGGGGTLRDMIRNGFPHRGLGVMPDGTMVWRWRLRNVPNLLDGMWRVLLARSVTRLTKVPSMYGCLHLSIVHADGRVTQLGLASVKMVTTTGVGFIVDAFQNLVELELMNFHGFGTGATAEAVGNTAIATELTTQYATDNTRLTGTQSENGSTVYRTVGTLDPDADVAITEHGILSQAATGGGVLLDRSLFSVVNLVGATGDALQATYDFTVAAGG